MAVNMDGAIAYAKKFVGKVPYSMYGPRDPEQGTADCSSFVYWAIVRGGGAKRWQYSYAPSTVTMPQWLYNNGFELIADNKSWNMQKGDIVIWGEPGNSYGSAGHTGICLDNQNWIEETGYIMNVGIFNHDARLAMAGYPYWQVFRVKSSSKPAASKPATSKPKTHDEAIAATPVKVQGKYAGKIEYFNVKGDKLCVRGWLTAVGHGTIGNYGYIIFIDAKTGKEITRGKSRGIKRSDVTKAYSSKHGEAVGLEVEVPLKQFKGKKVYVILRRANKTNGEGSLVDIRFPEYYMTL